MMPQPSLFEKNADSIMLLQSGKFADAYHGFREVLAMLQDSLVQEDNILNQAASQGPLAHAERQARQSGIQHVTGDLPQEHQNKTQTLPPENHYRPFARPFQLPESNDSSNIPFMFRARCCAIVLWNMGLSRHLNGIYHPNTADYLKAEHLYKTAASLLDSLGGDSCQGEGEDDCEQPLVLWLGLYNNLCHVYFQLSEPPKLQGSREVLVALLLIVSDSDDRVSHGAYVFFKSNVTFSAIVSASAPAA